MWVPKYLLQNNLLGFLREDIMNLLIFMHIQYVTQLRQPALCTCIHLNFPAGGDRTQKHAFVVTEITSRVPRHEQFGI
jgi:hypothetical protein